MQTPTPMKPPVHTPTMTIEKCLYNQESECGTTNNTYNINKNTDCCSKPVCNEDMSRLYPDVFKIIVPGINSVIGNYLSSPITSDVVSAITEEVYQLVADGVLDKLEGGGEITIQRNRQPYRPQHHAHRRKNPLLSDLIRITLVNLLLGGKNPYHGHGPFYRTSLPFPEDM
jgi:hypothetical protein